MSDDARQKPSPDPTRLASLLEFEIDAIRSELNSRGLSHWGLAAALATIVWLLVQSADSQRFEEISHLAIVFTIATNLFLLGRWANTLLSPSPDTDQSERIRPAVLEFGNLRSVIVLAGVRAIAIAVAWHLDAFGLSGVYSASLGVSTYFLLALIILILVLSYTRMPMGGHKPSGRKALAVQIAIFVTLSSSLSVATVGLAVRSWDLPMSPLGWRQGLLLAGAYLVLSELARIASKPALLETLVRLRRDVVLGESDLGQVQSQIQAALYGLRFDEYVQVEFAEVLATKSHILGRMRLLDLQMQKATELLALEEITDQDKATIQALVTSVKTLFDENAADHKIYMKKSLSICRKVGLVPPAARKDADLVAEDLISGLEEMRNHAAKVDLTRRKLMQKLKPDDV